MAEESEQKFRLEQRMISLQRENVDLWVKNRILSEVSSATRSPVSTTART